MCTVHKFPHVEIAYTKCSTALMSTIHTFLTQVVEKWDGNGVTVIVTGCSGGLGLESARCLASKGADVIM